MIPPQVSRPERQKVMLVLRQMGVSDTDIGRTFGVSRQRVGQIISTHHGDERDRQRMQLVRQRVRDCIANRETLPSIARHERLSSSYLYRLARELGVDPQAYAEMRRSVTRAQVKHYLVQYVSSPAFLQAGGKLSYTRLSRTDRRLADRANRIQSFPAWRQELGL